MNALSERAKKDGLVWDTAKGIYADLSRWPEASYYVKCANDKCGHVHGFYKTFSEARSKRLCPLCHSRDIARLKKEIAKVDEPEKPKARARAVVEQLLEGIDDAKSDALYHDDAWSQVDGDADAWQYGGAWHSYQDSYRGEQLVYIYGLDRDDDDDATKTQDVYRFAVDDIEPWMNVAGTKSSHGISDEDWEAAPLFSKILAIASYHGYHNFDSQPTPMTREELSKYLGIEL